MFHFTKNVMMLAESCFTYDCKICHCATGDHDAVLVLLLVARMISKAEIVIGGIRDKYPVPENIDRSAVLKTHGVDQYAFSARLLQLLYSMQV